MNNLFIATLCMMGNVQTGVNHVYKNADLGLY